MKSVKRIMISILFFILFGIILMGIMIGPNIKRDKVLYLNNGARNVYNELTKCIDLLDDKNNDEEMYFFGKINDNNDIILYDTKNNEISTLVSFSNISCPNSYWAICIKNGMISECWFAFHKIEKEELHFYSVEEQKNTMGLFEDPNTSDVVGYYKNPDELT